MTVRIAQSLASVPARLSLPVWILLCVLACDTALAQNPTPRRAVPVAPAATEETVPRASAVEKPLTSNREDDLFTYANLVYEQNMFEIAGQRFGEYLKEFPSGANTDAAWFRLGECYLNQRLSGEAEAAYLKVVREHVKSSFVPSAAYRLGTLAYNREDYKIAEPFFALADTRTTRDSIREAALYYRGRSLKQMGKIEAAKESYMKVLDLQGEGKFREVALLSLARLEAEAGDHQAAFDHFTLLGTESKRPEVRGEAVFKAGILADKLGNPEIARKNYDAVMAMRGAEEWKADAQFNLIESAYQAGDHKSVIGAYQQGIVSMPHELRPKLLLMAGNSYRHEGRFATAIDVYLNVERYYPNSIEAGEAGYRKLLCFYSLQNPNLPDFVDQFVATESGRNPDSEQIDMALLLKAESLFATDVMALAAETYDQIKLDRIPEALRASALYKNGWAHAESDGAASAVSTLTDFISRYPEDERIPTALAKRGLSFKTIGDLGGAERDFKRLLEEFPESDTRELAYQQIALIKGQQHDYPAMITAYEGLLEKFPTSAAAPEAWFWIGWGKFELRKFAECIDPLNKARELDLPTFEERATLRIVLAYRSLEDIDNARKEIDAAREGDKPIALPDQVYQWLGIRLFERNDDEGADKYLTYASTPDSPADTLPVIWKTLGNARLRQGHHQSAITAFDFYLASEQPDSARAKVLNDKAQALLALKEFAKADETVAEGIKIEREGRVNAQLCLTWGEIAIADQRWKDAVQRLIRPSYVFDDADITPVALAKSAFAHEKLGEQAKADEIRAKLRERFPDFKLADATATSEP
jgi:TolA-binding protein